MIDPAVLGTALIGLERIRGAQAMTDPVPTRRRTRSSSLHRLAPGAGAAGRGRSDAIDRTSPASASAEPIEAGVAWGRATAVAPEDVEYHPVPTRL